MKPYPESVLAASIAEAIAAVNMAKAGLKIALEEVQFSCEHRFVSEMPYASGGRPAERICHHCRVIEEGSHWSGGAVWSRHDHGKAILDNVDGRHVLNVTRDEFHKMRISV